MAATRLSVTLVFFVDGLLVGSWAARVPAVKHETGVTSAQLGLALFALSLGALLAMPAAGWLCERIGSRSVVVGGLVTAAGALALAGLAGSLTALTGALFVFGVGFGSTNVAANAQGLALERRHGRSILSSFHAAFSGGGLVGAGAGALAAAAGVAPSSHFVAVAVAVVAMAFVVGARLLPRAAGEAPPGRLVLRPPRALLVLGAAAFCTMLGEGAAADWSALYLSHSLAASAAVAALGYVAFSLAMATSRTVGDRLNEATGPVALVRTGGVLAASGLAFALVVGSAPAALVGFALMGAGLGVVVPVLFRTAGSTVGVSPGVGIAAVSTIGFLGFLAGPPTIGVIAGAIGLRSALAIVVLAGLMIAVLAGSARPRRALRSLLFAPSAVLSDLDGVLVDSSAVIETTWRRFAERHELDPERVLAQMHGRRTIDLVRLVAPHLDAAAEAARIEREEIGAAEGVRPLPGARELVAAVPPERFAIVTSGTRPLAVARLRAAGLPVPQVLVTAEQVERGKPDPAGYLRAAALLGVDPAHSLVLEDAPAGVEAGRAAGMTVVGLLTTNTASAMHAAHARIGDLRGIFKDGRA